jgi:hypothetical protein
MDVGEIEESELGGNLPDDDQWVAQFINDIDTIPGEKMVPEEGSPVTDPLRHSPSPDETPDENELLTRRHGGKAPFGSLCETPKKVETPPPSNAEEQAKEEDNDNEAVPEKKRPFKPSTHLAANKKKKGNRSVAFCKQARTRSNIAKAAEVATPEAPEEEELSEYKHETAMESEPEPEDSDSGGEPDDLEGLIINALRESDMSAENCKALIDRFNKGGSVLIKRKDLTDSFWKQFYVPKQGKNDPCPDDKEFRVLKDTPFNPEQENGNLKGTFIYVNQQEARKNNASPTGYCDKYIAHLAEPLHVVVAKAIKVMNGNENLEFKEYLNSTKCTTKSLYENLKKLTGNNEDKAPMWCTKANRGKGKNKGWNVKCLSPLNKGDSTAKVSYVCPHCTPYFVDFHQQYKPWEEERARSRARHIALSAEDDN